MQLLTGQLSDKDFFADFTQDMLMNIDTADRPINHMATGGTVPFSYSSPSLMPPESSFLDTPLQDLKAVNKREFGGAHSRSLVFAQQHSGSA